MEFIKFENAEKSITVGCNAIVLKSEDSTCLDLYPYEPVCTVNNASKEFAEKFLEFACTPMKMTFKNTLIPYEVMIYNINYYYPEKELSFNIARVYKEGMNLEYNDLKDSVTQNEDKYYDDDGEPIKCMNCGNKELLMKTTGKIENTIAEQECYCSKCGEIVGYWAYGGWDPSYMKKKEDSENYCPECGNHI